MPIKINWDAMGIATSIACAIHCAVLPLVLTSLPLFGINIIHNRSFEWLMITVAFAVGCYSLYHGYLRHHRSLYPVVTFAMGFMLLVFKQVFHVYEFWLLAPAVVLIIYAHYYNYKLCQQSKCCSPHHKH